MQLNQSLKEHLCLPSGTNPVHLKKIGKKEQITPQIKRREAILKKERKSMKYFKKY